MQQWIDIYLSFKIKFLVIVIALSPRFRIQHDKVNLWRYLISFIFRFS
jgi:hypothetical protein